MMLAAVEAMTNADPVWLSRCRNSNVAAQATAGESVHAVSPPVALTAGFILVKSVYTAYATTRHSWMSWFGATSSNVTSTAAPTGTL